MALSDRNSNLLILLALVLSSNRGPRLSGEARFIIDDLVNNIEGEFSNDISYESRFGINYQYILNSIRRSSLDEDFSSLKSLGVDTGDELSQGYNRLLGRLDFMNDFFERRMDSLAEKIDDLENQSSEYEEELNNNSTKTSSIINLLQWGLSNNISVQSIPLNRPIPIRIYVGDPINSFNTYSFIDSITDALNFISFEKDVELPDESGSWWKTFWAKSKDVITHDEAQERIAKLERAAEANFLDKPQAAANKDYAEAVSSILKSLENVNSACVQIGNILLVKHKNSNSSDPGHVLVKKLSAMELRTLERHQSLLKDPYRIMKKLEAMASHQDIGTIPPL